MHFMLVPAPMNSSVDARHAVAALSLKHPLPDNLECDLRAATPVKSSFRSTNLTSVK